jgi:hypothetical protein
MYVEPSFRAKQNGELSSKKSSSIKPVPQTDTGSQGENPKALEWIVVKELGKLIL